MWQTRRGHLKIFFSYAKNSGKTLAMLKAAQEAKTQGVSVLIGYIAPNLSGDGPEINGLEILNPLLVNGKKEFNLDLALKRKPDLLLIDELAHCNIPGSRHRKRYQDIHELLKAGIDVYTTVNVGNIESLHDTVSTITGISSWERIPDSVFDQADQVELIDIEPSELIERLGRPGAQASPFTAQQLTALRETALRRCADRVKWLSDQQHKNSFRTDEHILVC